MLPLDYFLLPAVVLGGGEGDFTPEGGTLPPLITVVDFPLGAGRLVAILSHLLTVINLSDTELRKIIFFAVC